MTITAEEAKYFEQVLRKRFRDGELTQNQIDRLEAVGVELRTGYLCIETGKTYLTIKEIAEHHEISHEIAKKSFVNNAGIIGHYLYINHKNKDLIAKHAIRANIDRPSSGQIYSAEQHRVFATPEAAMRRLGINISRENLIKFLDDMENNRIDFCWREDTPTEKPTKKAKPKTKRKPSISKKQRKTLKDLSNARKEERS